MLAILILGLSLALFSVLFLAGLTFVSVAFLPAPAPVPPVLQQRTLAGDSAVRSLCHSAEPTSGMRRRPIADRVTSP